MQPIIILSLPVATLFPTADKSIVSARLLSISFAQLVVLILSIRVSLACCFMSSFVRELELVALVASRVM